MSAPTVRKDGLCRVCKGPRTFNPQRGVPMWAYTKDPFCSSTCARKFYGTEIKNTDPRQTDPAKHRGAGIKLSKWPKYA